MIEIKRWLTGEVLARVTDRIFDGADLRGADLDGANLTDAVYSKDTQWPEGFEPQQHGVILVKARERRRRFG